MHAQNELSPYFAEIDKRTDNALQGIRQIRRSAKLKALPKEPNGSAVGTGLLVVLAAFAGLFLD
ncbi:MAG: hypothetical protein RIE06_20610 [Roseibium album]|uniref:hypothetical protein n=1 Tax=Roseibium album TaxID=311410 RepID=UPI000CF05091|nr:hypothetical protein [Labrenzia sp. EL_142]MBG6155934.1 hypothetical protein [Labrenzia sp. EL_162]MBG6161390.1 hypothetical protein [Labrenzia sp. EL_195]MBG6177066.1 hypothetical protein [Labrenzia sp. EL_132]MBG6194468.1 hypothetical protein [Labrenzia sp. EL_159]MBG6200600.1 hypothetical protein [Labrenzia sp. EL_13]MBG6205485.1 hypothetical protein [Labrenzia sp. EL_126]MBG6231655.1 hypothetical protein [Labrenzia sp. EL_208]